MHAYSSAVKYIIKHQLALTCMGLGIYAVFLGVLIIRPFQ